MHLQASALRAASLFAKNPAFFFRVMLAKLSAVRPMPALPARKRVRNIVFEYDLASYRGTAPMYFGSYAPLVVEAMKRVLKSGDIFFDVGANIGYLSAVAAGLVGTGGQVHCFEPVPAYFTKLRRFAELNPEYAIVTNSCAAGETPGVSSIYVARETGQSTMVCQYKNPQEIISTLKVPVVRLDSYIESKQIDRLALIKVDAEGFEMPILLGLQSYFEKSHHRPPIICEIAPRAYKLMDRNVIELAAFMGDYGYTARDLIDGVTPVDLCSIRHVEDVIFRTVA